MRRIIISILMLIGIGGMLVGCNSTDVNENNVVDNNKEEITEISETEKTIIEAQRLYDEGKYDEARNYIETVIFPNGSEYSEDQQEMVNEISANLAQFYVPPILNLTQEEAISLVLNHNDVVYYNFTGGESISDIVPKVSNFNLGNIYGYKIYVGIPNEWFPTEVGIYFVDSATGDIYKKNKEDRFELLQ